MRLPFSLLFAPALLTAQFCFADDRISTDSAGRVITRLSIDAAFRNPWPAAWEDAFWTRVNASLRNSAIAPGKYGGTYFENEKASYPAAFIGFLKGQRREALAFLQREDDAAWSKKLTLGVDWYPSFTLRGQVRKYFFFGEHLAPEYRKRMFDSAKIWTAEDPLRRPNEFWLPPEQRKARGMTGEGWTPEFHNSWVDVRGTDNLRAMRECAAYLMAEETGNAKTAATYKERIHAYVTALYTTGMGEWDSANYLSHGLTAYLGLYDFAKDPEVRLLAKAHLDWTCTAAALKYYRGSWAGPNIRDYGNVGPHAGAAGEFWHYFGELPEASTAPYRDFVHIMTSAYRPPEAVVELARKTFPKPVEILATKPSYDGWTKPGGESEPTYFETTWIGHHTQMGSLAEGHRDTPGMNLNGFRLLTENSRRGVDTLIFFTALQYSNSHASATNGADRLAQFRGNLIWMNAKPDTEFHLFLPKTADVQEADGRLFIRTEKTWIALHLIHSKSTGLNADATAKVCGPKKSGESPRFPEDHVWTLRSSGADPGGFALEIGEPETHGDFAAFREAVLRRSKVEQPEPHRILFTNALGEQTGIALTAAGRPTVLRNGTPRDWTRERALWAGDASSPVSLGWKQGTLEVRAGGKRFEGKLSDGKYSFRNE